MPFSRCFNSKRFTGLRANIFTWVAPVGHKPTILTLPCFKLHRTTHVYNCCTLQCCILNNYSCLNTQTTTERIAVPILYCLSLATRWLRLVLHVQYIEYHHGYKEFTHQMGIYIRYIQIYVSIYVDIYFVIFTYMLVYLGLQLLIRKYIVQYIVKYFNICRYIFQDTVPVKS